MKKHCIQMEGVVGPNGDIDVKLSKETEEYIASLPEDERLKIKEEIDNLIKEVKRNPYIGKSTIKGPFGWIYTFRHKLKWVKRELELMWQKIWE